MNNIRGFKTIIVSFFLCTHSYAMEAVKANKDTEAQALLAFAHDIMIVVEKYICFSTNVENGLSIFKKELWVNAMRSHNPKEDTTLKKRFRSEVQLDFHTDEPDFKKRKLESFKGFENRTFDEIYIYF